MCTCNGCSCALTKKFLKIQQDQRLIHFLMRLNDQFNQVRTNILLMYDLPTIQSAYRMLVQEERHKDIAKIATPIESMAFTTERGKNYDKGYEKVDGFKRTLNYNGGGNKRNNYFCDFFKIKGHSIQRCFKIHGYLDGKGKKMAANIQIDNKEHDGDFGGTGLTTK